MRAGEWTALLTAIAGVLAALAAIPATEYRDIVLGVGSALILLALVIGLLASRRAQPTFSILEPRPDEVVTGVVRVRGTVPALHGDTLWVVEDGWIEGRRAWILGGEARLIGSSWSFDYKPEAARSGTARPTLSVVRASRDGERLLRSIRPDEAKRIVLYDPVPPGCEVLGQVPIVLPAQA